MDTPTVNEEENLDVAKQTELLEQDLDALVQRAKKERVVACQAAINEVLARYRCRVDIVQVYVNGQLRDMQMSVVALDPQPTPPNGKAIQ